jgi:Xaa-Pro aminopeptidase
LYPHQLERLTGALAAPPLAALVGSTPANVAYLAGYASVARTLYPEACALAVMAPEGTALVVPTIDAPAVAEAGITVDHVIPYGRFVFDYADPPGDAGARVREWTARVEASAGAALVRALDTLGVRGGAIGFDEAGCLPAVAREIVASLGARRVVDGGRPLQQARQVKGPWEIETLERALVAAEEALNAVIQMLEPGVSEREAVDLYEAEVRRRGATPCCPLITFGPHTAFPAVPTGGRTLRRGDLVRLDVGCVLSGYHADVTRTAVMGDPDARQAEVFDAVAAGLSAAIDAMRPGANAGAIFTAAIDAVRAAGLPRYDRHHVGYGIGLDARETPVLALGSEARLEAGMVLRVETPYYEQGWGGAQVKDTVLVLRTGTRVMNRSHRGLVVLD